MTCKICECGRNESFHNQVLSALGMDAGYYTWLVRPSLGSMLIRQWWEPSFSDVRLSKSMRVASALCLFRKRTIPDWGGSSENLKNIVTQRTEIVIKFKKNILQYYSPRTLPRTDFYAKTCFPLFYFYFVQGKKYVTKYLVWFCLCM